MPVEHRVERRHLVHPDRRHVQHRRHPVHRRQRQPPAVLLLREVEQRDRRRLRVVLGVVRQDLGDLLVVGLGEVEGGLLVVVSGLAVGVEDVVGVGGEAVAAAGGGRERGGSGRGRGGRSERRRRLWRLLILRREEE